MPFVQDIEWKSLNTSEKKDESSVCEKKALQPVDFFLFNFCVYTCFLLFDSIISLINRMNCLVFNVIKCNTLWWKAKQIKGEKERGFFSIQIWYATPNALFIHTICVFVRTWWWIKKNWIEWIEIPLHMLYIVFITYLMLVK